MLSKNKFSVQLHYHLNSISEPERSWEILYILWEKWKNHSFVINSRKINLAKIYAGKPLFSYFVCG